MRNKGKKSVKSIRLYVSHNGHICVSVNGFDIWVVQPFIDTACDMGNLTDCRVIMGDTCVDNKKKIKALVNSKAYTA